VRIVITALRSATCALALSLAVATIRPTATFAQEAPDVYHPAGEEHPTSGKQDFDNHCAPCHGLNGKGHGPELNVLPDIHPSDLTKISLKNGGVFPRQEVEDMVDGRKTIPSHKRFDMPFWGVNFQEEGKEFTPESEAKAKARIDALVAYVESFQRQ
jgi:mono/diheme cytochrome c family protein